MVDKRRKSFDSLKEKVLDIDAYGRSFGFRMPNNKDKFSSWHGVFITLLIYSMLAVHGYIKLDTLLNYGDTTIMESMEADYYNYTYTFSSDQGLNFAFGVASFGSNEGIDPDYGQVIAQYEWWGTDGVASFGNSLIPTKKCSKEELGISEGNQEDSRFYPIRDSDKKALQINIM